MAPTILLAAALARTLAGCATDPDKPAEPDAALAADADLERDAAPHMADAAHQPARDAGDSASARDADEPALDGAVTVGADASPSDAGSPQLDAGSGTHSDAASEAGADANPPTQPDAGNLAIVVAAGANHSLHLSIDDGRTFCQVQREPPQDLGDGYDNRHLFRHISFANGHFVAGSWRRVLASENGYTWRDVTDGMAPKLGNWVAEIDFGNGYWLGVGGTGSVMRSSDLEHWQRIDASLDGAAFRSMVFGNGKFVASRDGSGWWSSTDGSTWTNSEPAKTGGVVFDDGVFSSDPGYRRARGVRLRGGGGGIQRAEDRDGAPYTRVVATQDGVSDLAFGTAPAADYSGARVMPETLASCLGLR